MEIRNLVDAGPLIGRLHAADASLVVLSEIHPDAKIITTARRDFTVYRRFGRKRLPVVLPPE